jgi:2-polyprenyl-6-methoxyphenol hydroxylase-like FAD-dependent oxidoreductase
MSRAPVILIVGAGPVGLTAALELARRGYRPRIVDRNAGPTLEAESRALAVHDRTLRLLEASGVTQRLIDAGNRVTGTQICRHGKCVARIDLSILGNPHPYILVLPQGTTERILEAALGTFDIKVERNTECTGLEIVDATAIASLTRDGAPETVTADYLLGADGSHSLVRQAAGIAFSGQESEPQTFGLVDAVMAEPVDPTTAVLNMLPDGMLGRIPISERLVRYISNRPDIGSVIPQSEPVSEIVWSSSFRIAYRHVETYSKGPVFLMGDAAHVHSPAGGRGMNLGMEDAAWFAWALAEGRLEHYSEDRLPYAIRTLKFSQTQTQQITGATRMRNAITATIAPWLLRIPPIRRLAVRNILALDTPLPPWLD